MTDQEINKRLALAIGWREDEMQYPMGKNEVYLPSGYGCISEFDYRYPDVIWPIAARFDCFPVRNMIDGWRAWGTGETAETPEKAVALAVIRRKETL